MNIRDGSKSFGESVGKFFKGVPILEDFTETAGEMGQEIPLPVVCDYFEGLEKGVKDDRRKT